MGGQGGHRQHRTHLCTSCTRLCVFMKKTSRSAFLCSMAAWVSSTLAICGERGQGPGWLRGTRLPAPPFLTPPRAFPLRFFCPQSEKYKVTN